MKENIRAFYVYLKQLFEQEYHKHQEPNLVTIPVKSSDKINTRRKQQR